MGWAGGFSTLRRSWSPSPLVPESPALSKDARRGNGPPADLHLADDVFLGHHAPVATVRAVVAVIAHHEVVALGNHLRPPVVVAAILARHVIVLQRDVIDVDAAVDDADRVAF